MNPTNSSAHTTSAQVTHVSADDLEDQITELAVHLNAANYRWLTLIAEFDPRIAWMVHKGEIVIQTTADGGWRSLNQDGHPYKGAYQPEAPRYAADALRSVHDAFNLTIMAGERMNYDLALLVLFDRVSAETSRDNA